jgi:hypothetical protein
MNTGNGASASFLRKNHTFCHLTRGLGIKKQKYGSTPGPDQMKMSTLPHTTNFMSEPCHSQAWMK